MPHSSDPLDDLLDQLGKRTPPLSNSLVPDMWRRVRSTQLDRPNGWWDRVHVAFARPSFAVAFVAACILLGLFLAEIRRSHRQTEYNLELTESYLRLVDPLLKAADRTTFAPAVAKS